MAFYWINGLDELVTCVSKSEEPKIISDELNFIHIEWRSAIKNDRKGKDCAGLYGDFWDGIKSGEDNYPSKGRHK